MREFGTVATPILRPDPEHTWIWSDLHLGDHAMVDAWSRPFRNVTHMNREPLAEWRRRVRPGDTIICLGDVAHPDAWREHSRLQRDLAGCPDERMHFEPCPHRRAAGAVLGSFRGGAERLRPCAYGATAARFSDVQRLHHVRSCWRSLDQASAALGLSGIRISRL